MRVCPSCNRPILLENGGISIDEPARLVYYRGLHARLSKSQFEFFAFLFKRYGRYVSCESMMDHLYQLRPECDWPDPHNLYTVKFHITQKLSDLTAVGLILESVHTLGWRLRTSDEPLSVAVAHQR